MPQDKWTREETIIAFNVYCKIPFKDSNKNHPLVIEYAKILGRSPSALNMKIGNFGRLDPSLREKGIVGLAHGAVMEEIVWDEFNGNWEKLAYESEMLISKCKGNSIPDTNSESEILIKDGLEKEAVIRQRVNQAFFRSMILASYDSKCCITGLPITGLLVASHIVPWAKDLANRLNPRNGLCLNSIHDKAFDLGYLTITPDFEVKLSPALDEFNSDGAVKDFFLKYEDQKITLPNKFIPCIEFLEYHNMNIFIQ